MSEQETPVYSVVVPVYGTAATLTELAERLDVVFREQVKEPYELIFVDDDSPNPRSWPTLSELASRFPAVRALRLSRNFGQHAATLCGMEQARGAWVITMDDDLQHLPEDVPKLIARRDHDIVIGQLQAKRHSLLKRLTSTVKGCFDRLLLGRPAGLRLSSFRLCNRLVVDGIRTIHTPFPFIPGMMFYISKDAVGVDVSHAARKEGHGNYSLMRLLRLFSNLLISNSSFLLRIVGYAGILCSIFSVMLAGYFVIHKVVHGTKVSGWTSLMVTILLLGGLILFALGVIGEYLIRIISGTENKPTYFVRARAGLPRAPMAVPVAAVERDSVDAAE